MHRILLAEDDKKVATILTLRLRREGYDLDVARDGTAALEAAERERYSLVIMNINLQFTNGFRAARRIKATADQSGTPVIFITTSTLPVLRDLAESMGAAGFFAKPYEGSEILAKVRDLLEATVKI